MNDSYLRQAINHLMVGLRQLRDAEGHDIAREVQDHLMPYPGRYPFICLYPGGAPSITDAGAPYDRQTFVVVLRYIVGKTDTANARYQSRLWDIAPLLVNNINRHPDLVFQTGQEAIAELDAEGVFCRTTRRFGLFNDGHIGLELEITLPFDVEIEEETELW